MVNSRRQFVGIVVCVLGAALLLEGGAYLYMSSQNGSLTAKPWTWVSTEYHNGETSVAEKGSDISIIFNKNGGFGSKILCNTVSGQYTIHGGYLTFGQTVGTDLACLPENGGQRDPIELLINSGTSRYHFTADRKLVIEVTYKEIANTSPTRKGGGLQLPTLETVSASITFQ